VAPKPVAITTITLPGARVGDVYPGNVQFTASVTDSWTPPMSATRTFTIPTILEAHPPKPDGSF
jgi:hypothetical protein